MVSRRNKKLFATSSRKRHKMDYRNASIGPGMHGYDHQATRRMRNGDLEFTKRRTAKRTTRGEIDHVIPRTSTRESYSDFTRRSQRRATVQQTARKTHLRNLILAVVLAVIAIAVAVGVASCAYTNSVSDKMKLKDSAAAAALVDPAAATDPYYVLIAGTFNDPAQTYQGPDLLILARLDPTSKQVTLVSIPSNMIVTLSDGKSHFISEAETVGGDSELISTVSSFAGVDIAHYLKVDGEGFKKMVDALGGVPYNVVEEVDDPDAGDVYLAAGEQTLNGAQALTLCRANNYLNTNTTRAKYQMGFLEALASKALSAGGVGALSMVDSIAGDMQTDLSANEMISMMDAFRGIDMSSIYTAIVPGSTSVDSGTLCFYSSSSSWATMMATVIAGGDPSAKSAAILSVAPSKYSVTVKNGSGVDGNATQVAAVLKTTGYQVGDTGNTDSYAYNETLVIYKDSANSAVAEAIVDKLGVGRTVAAGIYYSFDTDIEVIVGKDWKTQS